MPSTPPWRTRADKGARARAQGQGRKSGSNGSKGSKGEGNCKGSKGDGEGEGKGSKGSKGGGRRCWPKALSDPSPEGLCNVVGIGDEPPIVINSMDVNSDLVTEVQCASLMRPLRRTLLALCKVAGVVAPTYTWE